MAKNITQEEYIEVRQDFIVKACKWLKEYADCYVWYDEFAGECGMADDFIPNFCKAMEEE